MLSPNQIGGLLDELNGRFGIQQGAEITLEMDPASFDKVYLESVIYKGVNRISLGGQSFDDDVLKKLGRRHTSEDLIEACSWMDIAHRDGSLKSWSLDLIQNLPGQSLEDWEHQLTQAVKSNAPHLSVYDLSIEPGTVFHRLHDRGHLNLPGEDLSVQIINFTSKKLAEAGLSRYEISNHARPGHASRHNRVYWSGAGWWGFGMAATSAPWGKRIERPKNLEAYRIWIESSKKIDSKGEIPLDDILLVGMRRREGVDLSSFSSDELQKRFQHFLEHGIIQKRSGRWQLTDPKGMALSNKVFLEVVMWWESIHSPIS